MTWILSSNQVGFTCCAIAQSVLVVAGLRRSFWERASSEMRCWCLLGIIFMGFPPSLLPASWYFSYAQHLRKAPNHVS
jgi:hypothetical protein